MISVSIISHHNGVDLFQLLPTIISSPLVTEIFVVLNVPETADLVIHQKIIYVSMIKPRGFGENHNFVSRLISNEFFLILNPDIEFDFSTFLPEHLNSDFSVAAPRNLVFDHGSERVDIFQVPTLGRKLKKLFWSGMIGSFGGVNTDCADPCWVSGCFQLWRLRDFRNLDGFDCAFFMYYEDVDICLRAKKNKMSVKILGNLELKHHGAFSSRKNFFLFLHHLKSAFVFNLRFYRGDYR